MSYVLIKVSIGNEHFNVSIFIFKTFSGYLAIEILPMIKQYLFTSLMSIVALCATICS